MLLFSFAGYTTVTLLLLTVYCNTIISFRSFPLNNVIKHSYHKKLSSSSSSSSSDSSSSALHQDDIPSTKPFIWTSGTSIKDDFYDAIDEVIDQVESSSKNNVAIFFVSSIYEYSAYHVSVLYDVIKKKLPHVQHIIGCTTGGVIGSLSGSSEPVEVEARASISLMLASLDDDIGSHIFQFDQIEIDQFINGTNVSVNKLPLNNNNEKSITFLLATESSKKSLSSFIKKIGESMNTVTFGAVASSVTSLHMPKLFISSVNSTNGIGFLDRLNTGAVGLVLSGNITVHSIVARSCLPVGPIFVVDTCSSENEILTLKLLNEDKETEGLPPLVQLDHILNILPNDQSYMLKRELLVGLIPPSTTAVSKLTMKSLIESPLFFGQKPLSFDPYLGSLSIPCLPGKGSLFQFCIRDVTTARQDLQTSLDKVSTKLEETMNQNTQLLGTLLLGSMERGNKVFRHQNWESIQLSQRVKHIYKGQEAPMIGLFSHGTLTDLEGPAVMDTDSVYSFITKIPSQVGANINSATKKNELESISSSSSIGSSDYNEDVMTSNECQGFSDIDDGVIVSKRDPESAHPTRVAGMDYYVPDKYPQPKNVLESLVWDREKDIDRMRERFQMSKALIQAKAAEGKFPKRDFLQCIKDAKIRHSLLSSGGDCIPPIMIQLSKDSLHNSLHNGKSEDNAIDVSGNTMLNLKEIGRELESTVGAISIGCHTDYGTFRGLYEDLEELKLNSNVPILCDDFVVYGYQIFKAKASGADAIKLMGSILSTQDLIYLLKIARALRIFCVVVVSSKTQMLDVLENVADVQAISVTSRNMRLWKLESGKATKILRDPVIKEALAAFRAKDGRELVLLQEGFSDLNELREAHNNGIDAVILGEELLYTQKSKNVNLIDAVRLWTGAI